MLVRRMMRSVWVAVALLVAGAGGAAAQQGIGLEEVVASFQGNEAAAFVELGMAVGGAQAVGGKGVLLFDDASGAASTRRAFTLPNDVALGVAGGHILVATTTMAAIAGLTPDFTLPDGYLSPAAGRVCWASVDFLGTPIDCVAWGAFTGDTLGFGRPLLATPENRALLRVALTGTNRRDWSAVLQPTLTNNAGASATLATACGNGAVDPGEDCEPGLLGGKTCASLGFAKGKLHCTQCRYDTTSCTFCGNGALNGKEQCDGAELGGRSCESLGFTGGTLSCSARCRVDTSTCDATFFVPGGGPRKPDCQLEWRVRNAAARPGVTGAAPPRVRCHDGDAGCDTDAVAGTCTLPVALCVGRSDARLPKCTAAATASIALLAPSASDPTASALLAALAALGGTSGGDGVVAFAPSLAPGTCTETVPLVLPVGTKVALRVRAVPAAGARDADVVRIACLP
jgi:hypothetical protein